MDFHLGKFGHTILPAGVWGQTERNFEQTSIIDRYNTHGHYFHSSGEWVCYGGIPENKTFIDGFYHIIRRDPFFKGIYPNLESKKCKDREEVEKEGMLIAYKANAEAYFFPQRRGQIWHCSYWCPEQEKMVSLVSNYEPSHILGMRVDTISGPTLLEMYEALLSGARDKIRLRALVHAAVSLPINR